MSVSRSEEVDWVFDLSCSPASKTRRRIPYSYSVLSIYVATLLGAVYNCQLAMTSPASLIGKPTDNDLHAIRTTLPISESGTKC